MNRTHISDREPGNLQAYRKDRCRCYPCSNAWSAYDKRQQRSDWKPYVDVQPVRDHLAYLSANGIGLRQVEKLTGCQRRALQDIATAPRRTRIRPATAKKILAIQVTIDTVGNGSFIDSAGTIRRLQALVALGFSEAFLTKRLGAPKGRLRLEGRRFTRVRGAYARAVRDLYNDLWGADPVALGMRINDVTAARRRAAASGWALPLEWDDDEIDNPSAQPRHAEVRRYAGHRSDQLREDALFIINNSPVDLAERDDRDAVAARLGIGIDYLDKLLKTAV